MNKPFAFRALLYRENDLEKPEDPELGSGALCMWQRPNNNIGSLEMQQNSSTCPTLGNKAFFKGIP
jgi:hypothetical protein